MKIKSKPVQKSLKMSSKKGSIKLKKPKVSKISKKDDSNGKVKKKKVNLKEMTADDFLSGGFEDIDVDSSDLGDNNSVNSFDEIKIKSKTSDTSPKNKKLKQKKAKTTQGKLS